MNHSPEMIDGIAAKNGAPVAVRDLSNRVVAGLTFWTIYADAPWSYRNTVSRAAAVNHYSTLSLKEICALPVAQLAGPNAHLHLGAPAPLLPEGLQTLSAWGFCYTSSTLAACAC